MKPAPGQSCFCSESITPGGAVSGAETIYRAVKRTIDKGIPVIISMGVVDYVGKQVQASKALGALSPRDKAQQIASLQAAGKKVAMVGDGINDAQQWQRQPSFAVQQASDIAKHSATARLLGDSLQQVDAAISIARATLRNIKQNLFFAFIYNCLGIPLAAFGLLNPMIAAAAMALSSPLLCAKYAI